MEKSTRNLLSYIKMHRPQAGRLALANALALLQSLALIPVPWIFGRVIDARLPQHDRAGLMRDGLLIVWLYLGWLVLLVAGRHLTLTATKKVIYRLRADVVDRLQRLSIGYLDQQDLGRLHASVINDSERVDVMSNFLVSGLLVSSTTAVVTFALLWRMDWRLTLMVAALVPLLWVFQRFFKSRLMRRHRQWKEQFEGFSTKVQELLGTMRLVRAYANEQHEQAHIEDTVASLSDRGVSWMTMNALYQGLMEVLMGAAQVLVLVYGGLLVVEGRLTPGRLVAYWALLNLLFNPVRAIVNNMDQYYAGRAALDALFGILNQQAVEPVRTTGCKDTLNGRVDLNEVSFTYPSGTLALDAVSLRASPGETVALVGPSGGGKSTLANLLLGFYEPQKGRILFDELPAAEWNPQALRRQMGVVPQAGLLLSGTVRSNILYGRLDADEEQVWRALGLACAEAFVRELPKGLDTEVGELGVRLSGGQRQRIAIARALLRDPRVLILDEATSALDALAETEVQQALHNLRLGRTTFVIAHRLSTVKRADQILVLNKGRVVQRGTHENLMAQKGIYRNMAEGQLLKDEG